ncbi:IPT/TIG domain-containing protein [Gallaecimonas sp. GXIMD4217]|uniref:IPT/TIG domain-containing protein n=1 Tax=Gallaecimonas sp. GXIMD4217 TaxID=3131927 RepID=UPI00311AE988
MNAYRKNWATLFVLLALGLQGCNGELTADEQQPDTTIPDGGGDDGDDGGDTGGDDGGDTGGDDGGDGNDGGDGDKPDPSTGTWENKDEDGDGVPDEEDDYPFDPKKSSYPLFNDIEPNDNPSVAVVTGSSPGFRVSGTIIDDADNGDLYQFKATRGQVLTALLRTRAADFEPQVYISNADGEALDLGVITERGETNPLAISVDIPADGLYNLSIIDRQSKGRADFTYEVVIFEDVDVDGVSDQLELAIGLMPDNQDSDGDGVQDLYEVLGLEAGYGLDFDGDGVPNILDLDSDNDGLSDRVEGGSDIDGDGLGNLLDLDSDGNSIDDAVEAGDNPDYPVNADYDGLPDFMDLDDDDDGLLDTWDQERLVRVEPADWENGGIQITYAAGLYDKGHVLGHYRIGDRLLLSGQSLDQARTDITVVLRGQGITTNLYPDRVTLEGIEFQMPEAAYDELFIVVNNKSSNSYPLSLKPKGTPILISESLLLVQPGDELRLQGEGFTEDAKVIFGGIGQVPSLVTPTEITVRVPDDVTAGDLYVSSEAGVSNKVRFDTPTQVSIAVGSDFSGDLYVADSLFGTDAVPYRTGLVMELFSLGGEGLHLFERVDGELNRIASAFKFVDQHSVTFSHQASADYDYIIANDLESLTLAEWEALERNQPARALHQPSALAPRPASGGGSQLNPTVTDYLDSYFDLTVEATDYFENLPGSPTNNCASTDWRDLFGYDGCVEVQNRTKLFLSTRVYQVDEQGNLDMSLDKLNKPARDHITNPWDTNIAAANDNTFLGIEFWATDKLYDLKECLYKPCLYQVLTPGVNDTVGPSPFALNGSQLYDINANKAKRYLVIRTVIDQIVLRFYGFIFDQIGADNVTVQQYVAVSKAIYSYLPKLTEEVDKLMVKDNLTQDDFYNFGKEVLKELYNNEMVPIFSPPKPDFGPLTKAILKTLNIDAQHIVQKLAQKAAEKWLPGYGQLKAAYELAQVADLLVDMGKAVADFVVVPTKADFIVTWGLKIVDIKPRVVAKDGTGKTIEIYGVGFLPVEGWIWDDLPEFQFIDTANSSHSTKLKPEAVNEQGNIATINLPADFIEQAQGPISITVYHEDQEATSPYDLLIGQGVQISQLLPDKGKQGDTITISGIGFSQLPSQNIVTFAGNGGRVTAKVIKASKEELQVVVPKGARTGDVLVQVGDDVSNPATFTVPYIVSIIYGDNGNLLDDVYKLKVDDQVIRDNGTPVRKLGPIELALTEGEHKVEIIGIKADDGIGTYYIDFAGDVVSVSGDALEGRDLTPNVVKTFHINVGSSANPVKSAARRYLENLQPEAIE